MSEENSLIIGNREYGVFKFLRGREVIIFFPTALQRMKEVGIGECDIESPDSDVIYLLKWQQDIPKNFLDLTFSFFGNLADKRAKATVSFSKCNGIWDVSYYGIYGIGCVESERFLRRRK